MTTTELIPILQELENHKSGQSREIIIYRKGKNNKMIPVLLPSQILRPIDLINHDLYLLIEDEEDTESL